MKVTGLLFAAFFFPFLSLTYSQAPQLTLSAHLTGFPEGTMMYLENLSTQTILDSTAMTHDKIALSCHLPETPELFAANVCIVWMWGFSGRL